MHFLKRQRDVLVKSAIILLYEVLQVLVVVDLVLVELDALGWLDAVFWCVNELSHLGQVNVDCLHIQVSPCKLFDVPLDNHGALTLVTRDFAFFLRQDWFLHARILRHASKTFLTLYLLLCLFLGQECLNEDLLLFFLQLADQSHLLACAALLQLDYVVQHFSRLEPPGFVCLKRPGNCVDSRFSVLKQIRCELTVFVSLQVDRLRLQTRANF